MSLLKKAKSYFCKVAPKRTIEAPSQPRVMVETDAKNPLLVYLNAEAATGKMDLSKRQVRRHAGTDPAMLVKKLKTTALNDPALQGIVEALLELGRTDTVTHILKQRKATDAHYMHAAQFAYSNQDDYRQAARILTELRVTSPFQWMIERMVACEQFRAVEDVIARIKAYILIYHKGTEVEAQQTEQQVYAYAAIAAAHYRQYEQAFAWGLRVGRCHFAWVEMVVKSLDNGDYEQVERFANKAAHLTPIAYQVALERTPEDAPWRGLFEQKKTDKALIST